MRIAYLSVVTGASGVDNVEQIVVTSRYRGCTDSGKEYSTSGNAYLLIFFGALYVTFYRESVNVDS